MTQSKNNYAFLHIYLTCVRGLSSLACYCWECDRGLLRNWNNSGNKRSGPGKAGRSWFSWMKGLLSEAVFELLLAFRQWSYIGKMENVLTLYLIYWKHSVCVCVFLLLLLNKMFSSEKSWCEIVDSEDHDELDSHDYFSGTEFQGNSKKIWRFLCTTSKQKRAEMQLVAFERWSFLRHTY